MHHDLVDLGVVRPSYLPGQERLRHDDQAIGQVRGGPDGRRILGGRFGGGWRFLAGELGAGGPQRLQQHRALQGRQPERAGQRPVLLDPPGQAAADPASASSAAVTRRCARANRSSWFAVIGPASPASVAAVAIRVSARTLAYDSRPAANRARIVDGRSAQAADRVRGHAQ
jgi:hypothetical protein